MQTHNSDDAGILSALALLRERADNARNEEEAAIRSLPRAQRTSELASVKYHYLDSRTRDQAMAGSLPPQMLPLLIDPLSNFTVPGVQYGPLPQLIADRDTGNLRAVSAAKGDTVADFVTAIPNPTTFIYAWGLLMDLMIRGSPENAFHLFEGLNWYGNWIIHKSVTHTWKSICRYHLRVTAKRFAAPYSVKNWYEVFDVDALFDIEHLPKGADGVEATQLAAKRRRITAHSAAH